MNNLDKYKKDLESLILIGNGMDLDLEYRQIREQGKQLSKEEEDYEKKITGIFESKYQRWFTESFAVIKQLLPDRLAEFNQLYKGDGKRKETSRATYNIQDWLLGYRSNTDYFKKKHFDDLAYVTMRFKNQLKILKSLEARFKSTLFDIRQLVQADLFDCEVDAARELIKHGFLRGAGAISGVVLEKHLGQVAANHSLKIRKKNPSISDFNDLLKNGGVIDIPQWRNIQRLGDIRNLCDHNKNREPKKEEVEELVDGVDKIIKSLF